MSLADLDRPTVTWHYDRWDQDIVFRAIDAKSFVSMAGEFNGATGLKPETLRFYCGLLAVSVESPRYTAEEWLEASWQTLQALVDQVLRINGLEVEEAKKNSTTPCTDSPSASAES